jgi:UDP-N-acetylglucosamine--N-acetylmuramyl-(pentapeptide) pyrophosphoryl-undecaprenol N-acetylglucosamine transferase
MMGSLRVIIAGGGTGGHIFPAIAIGHALQRLRPGTQLLFVGAKNKMEMEKVPQEGFEIIGLDIAGFNRSSIWKNISLPIKLLKSRIQAGNIVRQFAPGAIVGVGGYASFPVLHAGQSMNIPTLIQEQNSFAGKSNKILGRRAKAVCVAYENMDQFFPAARITITGNPVRKSISEMSKTREDGKSWFGLDSERKTILVIGGSLGAKSINESVAAQLDELMNEEVQVIWQTGKHYLEQAARSAAAHPGKVKVFEFIREMDYAYAAADIVVSRAGALAIAELCIAGKPVIFVPYPFAAEDHQTSNAMALVTRNAALLVKDSEARTELIKKLKTLLHDNAMQQTMSVNLKEMAIRDADERIAKKVIEIARVS